MWRRIGILLRARLAAGQREGSPIAALLAQALVATFFCGLVHDSLEPFPYALFALTLTASLVAIPLIGELGWILRRDPSAEWIGALPITDTERKIATTLYVSIILWGLSLASLLPAAFLLPESAGWTARLAFPLLGLGLVSFLAAVLLLVQNVLGDRAEALLVGFQTALVVAVVVGVVLGIRSVPTLARTPSLGSADALWLWIFPPAWFAAPLSIGAGDGLSPIVGWLLPLGVALAAFIVLAVLPAPAASRTISSPWIAILLRPARSLATKFWVRPDERGPFDLIFDALPLEREVVLRTVPMIGIPMAFLIVASSGGAESNDTRTDVLALLLFTSGIYLPILLTHVPASATPLASWIHRTAPVPDGAVESGAIKALCVRFLFPLYVVLGFIAWVLAGPEIVLRLALPGFLISVFVLRRLYRICVGAPPLSMPAHEIRFDLDWFGPLAGIAMVLTLLAVAANRLLELPMAALLVLLLGLCEVVSDRALRRRMG